MFLSHLAVQVQVSYKRVSYIKKCVDLLANDITGKRFEIKHHHSKKPLDISKNAILMLADLFYAFPSKCDIFISVYW